MYVLSDTWQRLKTLTGIFLRQRFFLWNSIWSVGVIVVSILLIYVSMRLHGEEVILHYTVYFGTDFIGSWYRLFKLPLIGSLLFVVHTGLALLFFQTERILSQLLVMVCSVLVGVQGIAALLLVLAN